MAPPNSPNSPKAIDRRIADLRIESTYADEVWPDVDTTDITKESETLRVGQKKRRAQSAIARVIIQKEDTDNDATHESASTSKEVDTSERTYSDSEVSRLEVLLADWKAGPA